MYVREMKINRFRHLRNINLGPFVMAPPQSDMVVFAGPNGGGKSSILELLGFALSQAWQVSWTLHRSHHDHSFEVGLAISAEEVELISNWAKETGNENFIVAASRLASNPCFYRSFNFPDGEYAKNPQENEYAFSLVTSALRNQYQRSLGFFLRADRYYPNRGFQRESIFNYESIRQKSHLWNFAYNVSDAQYADMYDYLVQQRYHYFAELGAHEHRRLSGQTVASQAPQDPLKPYDDLLQQLFPGYRFTDEAGGIPTHLSIDIPGGQSIPFNDLSSGEKEVFFILSYFLRHDVSNAIIMIDEPELHLHPELARKLIDTMLKIRPGNQVWIGTHNAEIIDEAGRDRVTYVSRDPTTSLAVAIKAADESDAAGLLRDLFGYSGYIGIARTMVFLEGLESSADRKILQTLLPSTSGPIKFIPAGGVDSQSRLNAAILHILESTIGYVRFYLLRDRDYLTEEMIAKYREHPSGNVYVFDRYHIENYLLSTEAMHRVLRDVWDSSLTASAIDDALFAAAVDISGEVAAGMAGYRMNIALRPQDFSLGNHSRGQGIFDRALRKNQIRVDSLLDAFREKTRIVAGEVLPVIEGAEQVMSDSVTAVESALADGSWRTLFPGRRLLDVFCTRERLGKRIILQNSLVKAFAAEPELIPSELAQVMETIVHDGKFNST